MHELAPLPVRTVQVLVVLFAQTRLVLLWEVLLLLQFFRPVGEGAVGPETAAASLPVATQLRLVLCSELLLLWILLRLII